MAASEAPRRTTYRTVRLGGVVAANGGRRESIDLTKATCKRPRHTDGDHPCRTPLIVQVGLPGFFTVMR